MILPCLSDFIQLQIQLRESDKAINLLGTKLIQVLSPLGKRDSNITCLQRYR